MLLKNKDEQVEQPPVLDAEDEAILDAIWDNVK